jgi:Zn-dependent protease
LLGAGIRLGRLFGIEIVADWSLIIIFALVAFNLGVGVFPQWHPGWSTGLVWLVALTAAVLFFVSVLLHELSHAIVGRAQGIPVPRITLFLFGGVSHMEGEPPSPKSEFLMAVVGPLTSILLGLLALGAAGAAGAQALTEDAAQDPLEVLRGLRPFPTLLVWLGPINLMLGVFNLVPGFPLDGGRVFRALVWGVTKDFRKATRWASRAGQGFAWILMGVGVTSALTGGLAQGLWLVLIGWFLNTAAKMSYRQLLVRQALADVPVSRLMRTDVETVTPSLVVSELVADYLMRTEARAFPVVFGDRLMGLVTLGDVRKIPRDSWDESRVSDVMTPASELQTMRPQEPAMDALQVLAGQGIDQLPVVEGESLVGMIRRQDIVRWLALHASDVDV